MNRVLVVDDATFMRTTIKRLLEKNGLTVVGEASNGQEGFLKYKEMKPDLVTMDITMPEVTGIEGLKLIMDYDPQARVIMVSAMGQEYLVREAVLAGAKSFIIKPFKEEYLMETIKKLL
ncbi:MAG: response regulator [Methylocystaceae bacterium]